MWGRILDAARILFLGSTRLETRLLRLEVHCEQLLVRLNDAKDVFNAAQARAEKAIGRREKQEAQERAIQTLESTESTPTGRLTDHVSERHARRNALIRAAAAQEEVA